MIDLSVFCSEASIYSLDKPFSIGAYTYATNGHLVIRVPRRADVPERDGTPAIDRLPHPWIGRDYRPLPTLPESIFYDCDICAGEGRVVDCPDCDDGTVECPHCGAESNCKNCDGRGVVPASEHPDEESQACTCYGGQRPTKAAVCLGQGRTFGTLYLLKISKLPGLRFSVAPADESRSSPSHFIFDGGEGLIMPRQGDIPEDTINLMIDEEAA
ncbi:hypothetical protein [Rhodomicrobium lacus]|uniref:hypothetical protein n=1 Tax=Rhodomicrobium lacus TaxID=2498452 RepID=UPI000F8F066D|nr:hypothetical protein [Rhodomicrobium lacus]